MYDKPKTVMYKGKEYFDPYWIRKRGQLWHAHYGMQRRGPSIGNMKRALENSEYDCGVIFFCRTFHEVKCNPHSITSFVSLLAAI